MVLKGDPTSFISLKFKDKDGNEDWKSLKDLGVSSTIDGNTWKLGDLDDVLETYLDNNKGTEFTRDVNLNLKKE